MKKLLIFISIAGYPFIGKAMDSKEYLQTYKGCDVSPACIVSIDVQKNMIKNIRKQCLAQLEKELEEGSNFWAIRHKLATPSDYITYGLDSGPVVRLNNDSVVAFGCNDIRQEFDKDDNTDMRKPSRVICSFAENKTTEFDAQGNIISGAKNFWSYRSNNNILFLVNKELIPKLMEKHREMISKQNKKSS